MCVASYTRFVNAGELTWFGLGQMMGLGWNTYADEKRSNYANLQNFVFDAGSKATKQWMSLRDRDRAPTKIDHGDTPQSIGPHICLPN